MSDPHWHDADQPNRRPTQGDRGRDRRSGARQHGERTRRRDAGRDAQTREMWVDDGDPRAHTRRMQAPPEARGRAARRQGVLGWLGTLPGSAGIGIVAGSALLGAVITVVLRRDPGTVLGVLLVLGTIVAGLAVRTRSARLIIPVP